MNADDLARALGAKRSGRQFVCKCPAHDDGAPSLIFWQGHSTVRLKCYAGCDPRDILAELRRRGLLLDGGPARGPRTSSSPPPSDPEDARTRVRNQKLADRIYREAVHIAGGPGALYFWKRGIDISLVPNCGGLRFHPRCRWGQGTAPCVIARYTDAITGEPRGIWRRPITGERPRALGPVAGCVIRLWPDEFVTSNLTLGEGPETVLSAALQITHRGTLLQPAWAAGCADGVRHFPVLAGIEALTLLVDHDRNGVGQEAAAECMRRWTAAGREVIRLTPTKTGVDFNDIIMRKCHG